MYPEIEVCSKCHSSTSFSRDAYEGAWMSDCCWRPAVEPDAVNLGEMGE